MKYSVIIPVHNEADLIVPAISYLKTLHQNLEIIVVDGQSTDDTASLAAAAGVQVVDAPKSRGVQCNLGRIAATGDILFFIHVDTRIPLDAFTQIEQTFAEKEVNIATFRMRFDQDHFWLNIYSHFTQYDSIWTRFGDQCIVVRKKFFDQLRGFPDWPLFEDVRFLEKARQMSKIHSLPGPAVTSARRFKKNGILYNQIRNALLLIQYQCGVSVHKLAEQYR